MSAKTSKPKTDLTPLPQVGAVLRFNSLLDDPNEDHYKGSRDWDLEGGAILVGGGRVLTVAHVHQTMPLEQALFVPGHGILRIVKDDIVFEHEKAPTDLDWLVLGRLAEPEKVSGLRPLKYRYLSRHLPGMKEITTYGWGDWRVGAKDTDYFADGIQRCRSFPLINPQRRRYSPLDLKWRTTVKSPFALRNNSGGAVLGVDEKKTAFLVGLMRAFRDDLHSASRIGRERQAWLEKELEPIPPPTDGLLSYQFVEGTIRLGKRPFLTSSFALPKDTGTVRLTVSASAGLFVQTELRAAPWDDSACRALGNQPLNSGRFLYRDLALTGTEKKKTKIVHAAVAALAEGPELRNQVEVQLCAAFYK